MKCKVSLLIPIFLFFACFLCFANDSETETSYENSGHSVIKKEYPQETLILEYEDGYLISETSFSNGIERKTTYQYIDGKLVMCITTSSDSQKNDITFFLRSPNTNELVAVKRNEEIVYVDNSFVAQNNIVINTGSVYETLENGSTAITQGDVKYEYSQDGTLIKKTSTEETVSYFYKDGVLSSAKTVFNDGSYNIEEYEDKKVVSLQEYDVNGVLKVSILYRSSNEGMIKTMYDNGRPVANIYYKEDNKRIDKIEYL